MKNKKFIFNLLLSVLFIFYNQGSNLLWSQLLSDTRICIDAGHGGHTSDDRQIFLPYGIVYWESEGDLQTALHLKDMLESLGSEVKLTRTENNDASDISLSQRSEIANTFGADYFHSIHTNGGGGNYSLVLYKEVNGQPSFSFAKEMSDFMAPNLEDLMKTESHFVRGDYSFLGFNLGVLRNTNMPATLSESSFHDLPEEGLRLKNSAYLKNYAWAIARSFLAYFEVDGFSTGRVGGVIRDITSDEVVNEVIVSCTPGDKSYTGDQNYNGFYAIGELAPGDYSLRINKEGYLENSYDISVSANKYLDLDLDIQYYNNGYPNVDFYMEGLPAGAGENIIFKAEKSTDNGSIVRYFWNFGDGTSIDGEVEEEHAFDVDGSYEVTLTLTDDEGKESSLSKNIDIETLAPEIPQLLYVKRKEDKGVSIGWKKNPESNILNYHIYYSGKPDQSDEKLLASISSPILNYKLDNFGEKDSVYYFRISAENLALRVSEKSDLYAFYRSSSSELQEVLIVDGFNRRASYAELTHDFVKSYIDPLAKIKTLNISSCANSTILTNDVELSNYNIVFWFLGDESTANETFNKTEQEEIMAYLESGGKLFVSGSEIGWDLYEKGDEIDKNFYNKYLKANFLADGALGLGPATGVANSGFEGIKLDFGVVYPEDFPDEVGTTGGSESILTYNNGSIAGIKYKGKFANSNSEGALVHIAFPLESVANKGEIEDFVFDVIAFFNGVESDTTEIEDLTPYFGIHPNVVSGDLNLYSSLPEYKKFLVEIFSMDGKVYFTQNIRFYAGVQETYLPTKDLATGVYILRIYFQKESYLMKFIKR